MATCLAFFLGASVVEGFAVLCSLQKSAPNFLWALICGMVVGVMFGAACGIAGNRCVNFLQTRPGPHSNLLSWLAQGSVAICLAFIGYVYTTFRTAVYPPSDRELAKRYKEHQADFEKLAGMVAEDGTKIRHCGNLLRDNDPPVAGISASRLRAYRKVFARIGVSFETDVSGYPQFWVPVWHSVPVGGEGQAGLTFLPKLPAECHGIQSGCTLREEAEGKLQEGYVTTSYRRLRGDWYLYTYRKPI